MQTIFTFGFGQHDPLTGAELANRFVRIEANDLKAAKRKMIDRFGHASPHAFGNWAFDYPTEDAAGVDRYHLIEIDFVTGDDLVAS
jgi:hypothetical protein